MFKCQTKGISITHQIFSLTAGDIVDLSVASLMFDFLTAATKVSTFSESFLEPKEIFPTVKCIMGDFASVLKLNCPPSYFLATSEGLLVIVPFFGFGIKPFGPNTLATFANFGIISGEATKISNEIIPFSISAIKLSSATATRVFLPVPFGRTTFPEIPVETVF